MADESSNDVLAEFERLRRRLGFADSPAPLISGRYRLERVLGRGAMGEVHLARDCRLERDVALKVVRVRDGVDPNRLQVRLQREALALARIDHTNVIGIYDVGTHQGQTYFTMQFVAGTTLRSWQGQPGRSHGEIIDAYLQAARGLAAAHGGGLVHRDFKPDNVVVGEDGRVRVLDFGIAAALDPEPLALEAVVPRPERAATSPYEIASSSTIAESMVLASTVSGRVTQTGRAIGTPAYMSPEQLECLRVGSPSDQFGFCVALWEALSGRRPFHGDSAESLLRSIEAGGDGGEALPRWVRPILERGLARDPQQRWPSMAALIEVLERGRSRGRRLMVGAGLGLALIAAGFLGWVVAPQPAPVELCDDFVAAVDGPWNQDRREALVELAGVDAQASAYAVATVDELVEDWRAAARQRCHGEAAPPTSASERACLSAWIERLDQHLALLVERGDAETLALAPDLLARLRAPSGDYCALQPSPAVEPQVWRLADQARAALSLGETERAATLADEALARAQRLHADAGEQGFDPDTATAHAVRAEIAARSRQFELALEALALAERHAIGSGLSEVLLSSWVLEVKLRSLLPEPGSAARARGLVELAVPLAQALAVAGDDPRQGELLEAQALVERGDGDLQAAIRLHRRAQDRFLAAGQPMLAAKSLSNIGVCFQLLEDPEQARHAYTEAVALLDEAAAPSSYRTRINLERNLGLLDYAQALPAGFDHFAFIVAHGLDGDRIRAVELAVGLGVALEDEVQIREWSERALTLLEATPEASSSLRVPLQRTVGVALAALDDPRGEALLRTSERDAEALPLAVQFDVQRDWIRMLEDRGRCEEAGARRAAVIDRMDAEATAPEDYPAWRARGPESLCAASDEIVER